MRITMKQRGNMAKWQPPQRKIMFARREMIGKRGLIHLLGVTEVKVSSLVSYCCRESKEDGNLILSRLKMAG